MKNKKPKEYSVMENREFRDVMSKFATGVTVVSTEVEGEVKGMTVNAFMSVSLDPRLIAVSIDEKASLYHTLKKTGRFGISVLKENQQNLSMIFAKQKEKDQEIIYEYIEGNPVIKGSLANLSCEVKETATAGDHIIFIAEVRGIQYESGSPLIFFGGKYKSIDEKSK